MSVFVAIADPSRRQILEWLDTEDSVTATALTHRLPMSRQGVSKHLAVLEAAQLVSASKAGRETHFRAQPEALDAATQWIAERQRAWDARLDRLAETAIALSEESRQHAD